MKKILSFLIALMTASLMMAQSSLVVTVSNGTIVKTFQGNTALTEALKVAGNGDVVTMSNGRFFGGEITKNITLRGVGMSDSNAEGNVHGTSVISGTLRINIPETETGRLRMEGVYLSDSLHYCTKISNAMFEKCRFNTFRQKGDGVLNLCNFLHCRIAGNITLAADCKVSMSNCVVWGPCNAEKSNSGFEFRNCIVSFPFTWTVGDNKYYRAGAVQNSTYRNCIINTQEGSSYNTHQISNSCTVTYCVGNYYAFINLTDICKSTCWIVGTGGSTSTNLGAIFKTSTNGIDYSNNEKFILTDAAKTKYIGSDGTEVGLYGGSLPYDENPVRPQLLKVTVAKSTDENGHLPVYIQAKDAEY